ncbi:MAG: hypothetical protein IJ757_05355 [Clostridiales bacterium]|nr:hypothetical protein [Clostridiales bacterium]
MWKKITDNKDVIFCFLGSKLFFVVILLITGASYSEVLGFFDASHYRTIAQFGYYHESVTVFFPMVPLLIRLVGDVGMVIINQIAYLVSLYFLKQILLKLKGGAKASTVLTAVALSPMALFTSIEYTESLFFLFTVVAFYLFVTDKYKLVMGVVLGLSVFTRNTGSLLFLAVFLGMVVRLVKDRAHAGKRVSDILLCYVPATAISLIYPVFLQLKFGNWKIFMDAQYDYWIRIRSNIFKTTWISLKLIFTDAYEYKGIDTVILFKINEVLSVGLMALVIVLIVREILIMKRTGKLNIPSFVGIIYSVLFMLAICLTIRDPYLDCPTDSFYRYYTTLFPIYLGIGRFREKGAQLSFIVSTLVTVVTASMFCLEAFFF